MTDYCPPKTSVLPFREKLLQRIWSSVQCLCFRISPFFARKWRVLWVKLFAAMGGSKRKIAITASVARTAQIDFPWNVSLGDRATIDEHSWLYGLDKIVVDELAIVGRDVKIITGTHDISSSFFALKTKPVHICKGAWIATGAMILPGVTIGEGAVVGAGAVVAKDVKEWSVVAGNPAKVIGERKLFVE